MPELLQDDYVRALGAPDLMRVLTQAEANLAARGNQAFLHVNAGGWSDYWDVLIGAYADWDTAYANAMTVELTTNLHWWGEIVVGAAITNTTQELPLPNETVLPSVLQATLGPSPMAPTETNASASSGLAPEEITAMMEWLRSDSLDWDAVERARGDAWR